eukprot:2423059-Pleurochrysis_carterae.AAC.1
MSAQRERGAQSGPSDAVILLLPPSDSRGTHEAAQLRQVVEAAARVAAAEHLRGDACHRDARGGVQLLRYTLRLAEAHRRLGRLEAVPVHRDAGHVPDEEVSCLV